MHDHVGSLAQLARLLIQVVQAFTAAFPKQFARLFAGENRRHQPTDGSQTYTDNGQNNGTGQKPFEGGPATPPYGDGVWTFSRKFGHLVHFAGVPHVNVHTSAVADRGNLVVDVYDVDGKGNALLFTT